MSKMGNSGDQDYIDRIRMEALVADALRQADRDNERVVVRREEKPAFCHVEQVFSQSCREPRFFGFSNGKRAPVKMQFIVDKMFLTGIALFVYHAFTFVKLKRAWKTQKLMDCKS